MARFYHIRPLGFAGDATASDQLQRRDGAPKVTQGHPRGHPRGHPGVTQGSPRVTHDLVPGVGADLKFQAVTRFAAGAAEAAPACAETNVIV